MPGLLGDGAREGGCGPHAPLERGAHVLELRRGEPAADPARVHQLAILPGAEVQRSEPGARALGPREAHDHEVVNPVRADLEPVGRAAGAIRRVRLLGDDALEPEPHHLLVQRLAVGPEVLEVFDWTHARYDPLEQRGPLLERQRPEVEALEREQVEYVQHRRRLDGGASHFERPRDLGAVLQSLEHGPPRLVRHHQLAIEDEPFVRERDEGARNLGERPRDVVAVARDEPRPASPPLSPSADTVPVELQLEQPPRLRERSLARLREHRLGFLERHGAARRLEALELLDHRRRPVLASLQLVDGQAGEHGFGRQRPVFRDVAVLLLDEQPLLLALLELHQGPLTVELVATQLEEELPFLHALVWILERHPAPAVPDNDRPRAVIAFGDEPLEVPVLERVVFHVDRQALVGRVGGGPLGNRPGREHAADFEAQVPVEPARGVHMDHEETAGGGLRGGRRLGGPGLGRTVQGPLGAIRSERIGAGLPFYGHKSAILSPDSYERTPNMSAHPIGSATLSFGLVSVPIKLFSTGESSAAISFNWLHKKDGARLKQQYVCSKDGDKVEKDDMVKGYEFTKGQYVIFKPEDLKALEEKSTNTIEVTEFVPADQVDRKDVEKSYFLGPDKGGDRAYRLLAEALKQTERVAVGQYAARGKQYLISVRPEANGLLMEQLRYANETRSIADVPVPKVEVKKPELQLAVQLVEQASSDTFKPENYEDNVRKRVLEQIQRKVEGKEITEEPAEAPKTQIIDLMEALKASLKGKGAAGGERKPAKRVEKKGAAKPAALPAAKRKVGGARA